MAFSLATILLQAGTVTVDSTAAMADSIVNSAPVQEVTKVVVEEFSVLDLLGKGGYVMYPIGIRKTARLDEDFLHKIHDMLQAGNVQGAINFCKSTSYPIAKLLEKGLSRLGSPIRDIEAAIENKAKVEIYNMEKNLGILSAIARIAPMFGFLGTVTGMIRTFHNISISNKIDISTIAGGIYEKMVTSASGLIVGIIAYVLYTLLTTMIDRTINKMEITAIDFLDILHKPASKA